MEQAVDERPLKSGFETINAKVEDFDPVKVACNIVNFGSVNASTEMAVAA